MQMNCTITKTGGLIFLLLLFLTNSCDKERGGIQVEWKGETFLYKFRYSVQNQPVKNRIWNEIVLKKIPPKKEDDNSRLYIPVSIQKDSKGNVYVLDQGDKFIKKFNVEGQFLEKLGSGEGRGPGELLSPFDLAVDSTGNIYIIDLTHRALISLDNNGEFRWQKVFKYDTPGRVAAGKDIVFISVSGFNNISLFQSYTINGAIAYQYNSIVKFPDTSELPQYVSIDGKPLIGKFVSDSDDRLIFAPRFISHIIFYKNNGTIDFGIKTIDQVPLPKKSYTGEIIQLPNSRMPNIEFIGKASSLNINVLGDKLTIWNNTGTKSYGSHVIDIYNINNGIYEYSIKLKEISGISDILISPKMIYTLNLEKGLMEAWQIEKAPWL